MPLGPFELEVLRLLAANRNPDSYVAGATVLNQDSASPRTSKDVDVFHGTGDLHLGALAWTGTGKDPGLSPDFPTLTRHFGSVKGAWPRIVEG